MAYLDWLEEETANALAQGLIGEPVAVRGYLQIAADHGLLLGVLARGIEAASRWFDSPARRVGIEGSAADGHLTALAEFRDGETALLTAETFRKEMPSVVLLIFGNHGTMRYDDAPRAPAVEAGPAGLVRLLNRALKTGEVVEVRDGR